MVKLKIAVRLVACPPYMAFDACSVMLVFNCMLGTFFGMLSFRDVSLHSVVSLVISLANKITKQFVIIKLLGQVFISVMPCPV